MGWLNVCAVISLPSRPTPYLHMPYDEYRIIEGIWIAPYEDRRPILRRGFDWLPHTAAVTQNQDIRK